MLERLDMKRKKKELEGGSIKLCKSILLKSALTLFPQCEIKKKRDKKDLDICQRKMMMQKRFYVIKES